MAFVIVRSNEGEGKRFDIEARTLSVGRAADNVIQIDDPAASGHHCAILRDGAQYTLQDLGSTNGTRLNGAPVGRSRLKPGDFIRVGSVEMEFDGDDVEVEEDETDTPSAARMAAASAEGVSAVAAAGGPSQFGKRRNRTFAWMLLTGIIVGVILVALGYWFLSRLFGD